MLIIPIHSHFVTLQALRSIFAIVLFPSGFALARSSTLSPIVEALNVDFEIFDLRVFK